MRHDESIDHIHLYVSIIETVITASVIVLLTLNVRVGYIKVQRAIEHVSVTDPHGDAHLRSICMWMWLLIVVGVVHLAGCVGCFFLFNHLSHLGWTLLSNQVFIITLTFLVGLYTGRVVATVIIIKEDQHKVSTDVSLHTLLAANTWQCILATMTMSNLNRFLQFV